MKLTKSVMLVMLVTLTTCGVVYANPYASQLNAPAKSTIGSSIAINYFLNQQAETVEVNIYNDTPAIVRTLDASEAVAAAQPGIATGANSVVWDTKDDGGSAVPIGVYTYEIVASDSIGFATWTQISYDEPQNAVWSPRGVTTNKNPLSPYFGRVYMANRGAGTSTNPGAFPMDDGVYIYNSDLTFAEGTVNGSAAGNAAWVSIIASPKAIKVGEDDSVYLSDWGNPNPTVLQGDPDFSDPFGLLDYSAGSKTQYVCAMDITGTGTNRALYTIDDTYDLDTADWVYGAWHFWMYDIGDTATVYTATPAKIYDNGPDIWQVPVVACQSMDVVGDMVYVSDRRYAGNGPIAYAFDVSSSKLTDGTPYNLVWTAQESDAIYELCAIGDLNVEETLLCYGMGSAKVAILDVTDGSVVDAFQHPVDTGELRGAAWDGGGNVVTVTSYNEWIRLWSPPGPSSYTTPGPSSIELQAVTGVEGNHWSIYR